MPQFTASTARRSMVRSVSSSGVRDSVKDACKGASDIAIASPVMIGDLDILPLLLRREDRFRSCFMSATIQPARSDTGPPRADRDVHDVDYLTPRCWSC